MASTRRASRPSAVPRTAAAAPEELPDYCARPSCRRAFTRTIGPGRPQAFCSDICRRAAERELRQTKARLTHFEALTDQLRVDVAAFGRTPGTGEAFNSATPSAQRGAEDALNRVAGILSFLGDSDDALARELRNLYQAVAPVINSSTRATAVS